MLLRPKARELIIGLADDPTFGPVVVFGSGGTAVEVIDDKALALPPLDLKLAADLINRTRVSRLLRGYRNVPPADRQALELMLVKVAQLAADLPEVRELDLNPVLADDKRGGRRRRARGDRAGREGEARALALRHPALSEGMGTPATRPLTACVSWCGPFGQKMRGSIANSSVMSPRTTCGCASSRR